MTLKCLPGHHIHMSFDSAVNQLRILTDSKNLGWADKLNKATATRQLNLSQDQLAYICIDGQWKSKGKPLQACIPSKGTKKSKYQLNINLTSLF